MSEKTPCITAITYVLSTGTPRAQAMINNQWVDMRDVKIEVDWASRSIRFEAVLVTGQAGILQLVRFFVVDANNIVMMEWEFEVNRQVGPNFPYTIKREYRIAKA